jgi:hypothetical protein
MTDLAEKIYVIRNLAFFYDDEFYSTLFDGSMHLGRMSAVFDDQDSALQEWKRLEYEFSHRVDFMNIFQTQYTLEYYKKFGIKNFDYVLTLDSAEFYAYFKNLDPEALFDVIHKADFHVYYLYEYPKNLKQYVGWNDIAQKYETCDATTDYDYRPNLFLEADFLQDDPLLAQMSPPLSKSVHCRPITVQGSLTMLSDTPLLLAGLIAQNPNLEYLEQRQVLCIKPDDRTLASVNALLKQPLSEKQYLTIPQIFAIEQQLDSVDS